MTKKEIVRSISDELGLPQQQVKQIVQKLFTELIETLAEDGRIELRNFGVFEVKVRAARSARNPKTGEQMPIPARSVVTFKPGKEMEEQVEQAAARKERLAKLANSGNQSLPPTQNETPPSNSEENP
jgi:nucleoid DNA-binding protein